MMDISRDLSRNFTTGSSTVTTTSSAVCPSTVEVFKGLQIKAGSGNAGVVYVGKATVTADGSNDSTGVPLAAGEGLFIPVRDVTSVYAIADGGVNKVFWLAT
jgi:hypothetical protein